MIDEKSILFTINKQSISTKDWSMFYLVSFLGLVSIVSVLTFYFGFLSQSMIIMILGLCLILFFVMRNKIESDYINFFKSAKNSFICPHCLKSIYLKDITDFTCPLCNESGKDAKHLFSMCGDRYIRYYSCPYCKDTIDLFAPYNKSELIRRSYDQADS